MVERVLVVGYGMVGARFVDEMLPAVREGAFALTVVGAEPTHGYNRVLVAEYAVGRTDRDALELTDPAAAAAAGVRIETGSTVVSINRTTRTVTLGSGERLPYDRLVLATGARANIPTLDGLKRPNRRVMRPSADAAALDSAGAPLPAGVTVLRDLDDARRVLEAVTARRRIVVLGAGVLGMEFALAAAAAGSEACVVYHDDVPMSRNLDRGGGHVLAGAAQRAGVAMIHRSRAESIVTRLGADGAEHFDALVCADGKQIFGDLLLLSCGVSARLELAHIAGLAVSTGVLVDENLQSWTDPSVWAIGDCAHVVERPDSDAPGPPGGSPSGLVGPGWRQAEWLARQFGQEASGTGEQEASVLAERAASLVMLKADGIDVVAAGDVTPEPWDIDADGAGHLPACTVAPRQVAQWSDPEHGRYVKMVTRSGILEGFVSVGMPRTAAELTLLFERASELPADRSVLLRYDGPDYDSSSGGERFGREATVCWCNGVTVGAILDSASAGNTTVACVSAATRAGTGCGGCKGRIGEVLEWFEDAAGPQELVL